jgi:hypothetical protein
MSDCRKDVERETFEQTFGDQYTDFERFENGEYMDDFLQQSWIGWQASRQVDGESVAYITERKLEWLKSGPVPSAVVYRKHSEGSIPLYTHPASAEVERLQARVIELVAVAVSVRDDLLLRSEIDSDGTRCVNLSASKWSSFCDVIDDNNSEAFITRKQAEADPKLARGRVWCTVCDNTASIQASVALKYGWPKCCGYTMTLDSPDERGKV